MPPIDVSNSLVQVAAVEAGPFATIEDVTSWDGSHGTDAPTRTRVFGKPTPYVRAGDDTDTYDLSGLLNLDDTNGQNILRDARDNRTTVFLRVMPDGEAIGKKGYLQECNVTEYTDAGDADAEYVECSFSLEGAGPKVDVVVAA